MSYRSFVREVARRAHHADLAETERAVLATLRALSRRLADVDARAVAAQLPPSLADVFMSTSRADVARPELDVGDVDPRLVRCACRLLAESLDEQARAHLRMQPLIALFV